MRSTIWKWSQSVRSSRNKENIRNTSNLLLKMEFYFFKKNQRCKIDVKWVGNCRGRLRPVQNDRTGFPEVLGVVGQEFMKNKWKNYVFRFFSSWTLQESPEPNREPCDRIGLNRNRRNRRPEPNPRTETDHDNRTGEPANRTGEPGPGQKPEPENRAQLGDRGSPLSRFQGSR